MHEQVAASLRAAAREVHGCACTSQDLTTSETDMGKSTRCEPPTAAMMVVSLLRCAMRQSRVREPKKKRPSKGACWVMHKESSLLFFSLFFLLSDSDAYALSLPCASLLEPPTDNDAASLATFASSAAFATRCLANCCSKPLRSDSDASGNTPTTEAP